RGVGVMVFADTFPESRQSGVIVVSHGTRIASNGDLRVEATPGQWSATPKLIRREVDREREEIRTTLAYPDDKLEMKGFNPIYYPDLDFTYELRVNTDGEAIHVYVDLNEPLPDEWIGEVGFNLELYPTDLFGKSWYMDDATGIFPRQPHSIEVKAGSKPAPEI